MSAEEQQSAEDAEYGRERKPADLSQTPENKRAQPQNEECKRGAAGVFSVAKQGQD
jgi:hypothetical protein